jgi:hypothetical protein
MTDAATDGQRRAAEPTGEAIVASLRPDNELESEERRAVECMLDMARMYAARAETSAEDLLSLALKVERKKPRGS